MLITLERYVAVCWPLRSKRWITMKKAVFATISVLIFSIMLNFPRWFERESNILEETIIEDEPGEPTRWKIRRNTVTTGLLMYTDYRELYHGVIWVTFMYAIPIPLLIGLNLKIWTQVTLNHITIATQNLKKIVLLSF